MRESRFRLEVNLAVYREERHDPTSDYWQQTQERLSVQESMDLGALDFMGVMGVLGRLHESVAAMKVPVKPEAMGLASYAEAGHAEPVLDLRELRDLWIEPLDGRGYRWRCRLAACDWEREQGHGDEIPQAILDFMTHGCPGAPSPSGS